MNRQIGKSRFVRIDIYRNGLPVAPKGCPRAIAPPFTFTFSGSRSNFLQQYTNWEANACEFNGNRMILRLDHTVLTFLGTNIITQANQIPHLSRTSQCC